jgi:tape measure domain-containing protein
MGGMGGFGRALGGVNLPGAGAIRELGQEFAFATQQVLLFGQAYKMLAFIQNFPAQVGEAVSQLQNFRNTLGAISPTAEEAASSNRLILDLVEKYNVPLQSARDGFTKLYASMAPAGFSGDEIRNLFTGITQAAATFGMSADKVDRVNYAFAQMASKGQVMSEELKGQLGDVLPGAMAIFAKAAGFEGPKAIQDFSAELEAGRYKGEAMVALLKNVGVVMRREFGPGAEGAALTFQGIINRMQNSMTLLYESFEPVAVGFLNTVVVPLTDGIRQISDGFNAFFTGAATKTSGGFGIAQELERLKPTFEGIGQNVKALIEQFGQFARAGLEVGKVLLQIAGNPFVGYLGRVYLSVLALTTAIQILNLRALIPMIANFARSAYALITFTAQCARAGQAVQITGLMLRTFFATTGVGIVLLGIGLLIEKFMSMNQALADTRAKALGAADAIRSMSQTEARAAEQSAQSAYKTIGAIAGRAGEKIQGPGGDRIIEISERELKQLQGVGAFQAAKDPLTGRITARRSDILSLAPQAQRLQAQAAGQIRDLRFQEQQAQQQATLPPIPAGGGDEKGNEKALRDADKLANQEQQLAIDAAKRQNDLDKALFESQMMMGERLWNQQRSLLDQKHEYELAGMNSIEARQRKFQQDLMKIELDRIEIVRKAESETLKAQQETIATQRVAAAAGGATSQATGLPAGVTQYITGDPSSPYYKADHGGSNYHEHLAFASRALAEAAYQQLTQAGVKVTEFKGRSPVGRHTPGSAHYSGLAFDVPGAQVPVGKEKELTARVQSVLGFKGAGTAYTRQRRTEKAGGEVETAQLQENLRLTEMRTIAQDSYTLALEKTKSLIKQNITSLFPVAELQLETSLMRMRNQLLMQGMPEEYIRYQEDVFKKEYEANEARKAHSETINYYKTQINALQEKQSKGIALTADEAKYLKYAEDQIKENTDALQTLTEQQKLYQIASLESAIATMKQADALKAMEEVSGRINDAVTGVTDTYKSLFKEIAMGEDSVEALKKAQQALADQFLTMVFDMAMKPVEESMKNTLGKMFGVPNEKEQREKTIASMEAQLAELQAHKVHLQNIETNTGIAAGKSPVSSGVPAAPAVPNQMTAAGTSGGFLTGTAALQTLPFNGQTGGMLQNLPFTSGDTGFLSAIGINGEELSASISESANAYSEQLSKVDTSVFESANALGTAGTELGKEGAAGKKWHESLGQAVGGLGMAAGAVMGIVAGINQIKEGGTSNVLGGIGMIASMAGSLLGSFGGLFGGGGGASSIVQGTDIPIAQMPAGMQFANGGVAFGGFRAFANGGTVSGPTLGLVGEGKYNEAIVPLPDGRSIPVQLGGRSARDLMGNGAPGMPQAPSLSMKFETTKINGVEYVSREQLEQAMAETRRASIAGGAKQGMSMTLDKIKQSPSTRSRIGIR